MQGARRLHCAPIQAVERRVRIAVARIVHKWRTQRLDYDEVAGVDDDTVGLYDGIGGDLRRRWRPLHLPLFRDLHRPRDGCLKSIHDAWRNCSPIN